METGTKTLEELQEIKQVLEKRVVKFYNLFNNLSQMYFTESSIDQIDNFNTAEDKLDYEIEILSERLAKISKAYNTMLETYVNEKN